jgi:hypothetical protein
MKTIFQKVIPKISYCQISYDRNMFYFIFYFAVFSSNMVFSQDDKFSCVNGYKFIFEVVQRKNDTLVASQLWDDYHHAYMNRNPIPDTIYIQTFLYDRHYIFSGFIERNIPADLKISMLLIVGQTNDCRNPVNPLNRNEISVMKFRIDSTIFLPHKRDEYTASTYVLSPPIELKKMLKKYQNIHNKFLNQIKIIGEFKYGSLKCTATYIFPICASLPEEVIVD